MFSQLKDQLAAGNAEAARVAAAASEKEKEEAKVEKETPKAEEENVIETGDVVVGAGIPLLKDKGKVLLLLDGYDEI